MSVFLLGKNNLGDVDNIEKARQNLGITSLSAQDPNNINISGGNITVDHFCLKQLDPEFKEGYILVTDSNGCGKWAPFDQSQFDSNTKISSFINDLPYASEEWTYNYFMRKDDNLSGLTDTNAAISNLGLDFLFGPSEIIRGELFKKWNNIILDKLIVNNVLEVQQPILYNPPFLSSNNVLYIDPLSYQIKSIEIGNDFDDIKNNIIDDAQSRPPSMYLLNEIYHNLNDQFTEVEDTLHNLVIDNYYLKIDSNLADIPNPELARSNLGLHGLVIEDDHVELGSIVVHDSFTLKPKDPYTFESGRVLVSDSDGEGTWSNLPEATIDALGLVKLAKDYGINPNGDDLIVPSLSAVKSYIFSLSNSMINDISNVDNACLKIDNQFSEYKDLNQEVRNSMLENLNILTNNINDFPSDLSYFHNDEGFLKTNNFLSELTGHVQGLERTRSNLHLKQIAWSASYYDLEDAPVTADFPNVYLQRSNNLSDIRNTTAARANLGLEDMATMSSDNVNITGGNISRINSINTNELIFSDTNNTSMPNFNSLSNILFLKAGNADGMATWGVLPDAGPNAKGILRLINNFDARDDQSTYTSLLVYNKISTLHSTITNLQNEDINLSSSISTNLSNIESLNTSIKNSDDGILTRISTNEDNINALQNSLSNSGGSIGNLSTTVSTHSISISNNNSSISNNRSSINSINLSITAITTNYIHLSNAVLSNNSSINDLTTKTVFTSLSITNSLLVGEKLLVGDSLSVSGALTGGSLSVSGALTGTSLSVSGGGALTGGSLTVSNALKGGSLSVSGALTGTSLYVSGDGALTGGSLSVSGALTGTSLSVSGALTGTSLSVSDALRGGSLNVSGALTGTSLSVSDALRGGSLNVSGALTGDSLNVSGALTGDSLSINSGIISNMTITGNLSVEGEIINTHNVHKVYYVDTYDLLVNHDIQFLNGSTDSNSISIYDKSLLITDNVGKLRWADSVRIKNDVSTSGFTLHPLSNLNMQIYTTDGKLYISKETSAGTNTYNVKHIFR